MRKEGRKEGKESRKGNRETKGKRSHLTDSP
jgi:hypothetical protein